MNRNVNLELALRAYKEWLIDNYGPDAKAPYESEIIEYFTAGQKVQCIKALRELSQSSVAPRLVPSYEFQRVYLERAHSILGMTYLKTVGLKEAKEWADLFWSACKLDGYEIDDTYRDRDQNWN